MVRFVIRWQAEAALDPVAAAVTSGIQRTVTVASRRWFGRGTPLTGVGRRPKPHDMYEVTGLPGVPCYGGGCRAKPAGVGGEPTDDLDHHRALRRSLACLPFSRGCCPFAARGPA